MINRRYSTVNGNYNARLTTVNHWLNHILRFNNRVHFWHFNFFFQWKWQKVLVCIQINIQKSFRWWTNNFNDSILIDKVQSRQIVFGLFEVQSRARNNGLSLDQDDAVPRPAVIIGHPWIKIIDFAWSKWRDRRTIRWAWLELVEDRIEEVLFWRNFKNIFNENVDDWLERKLQCRWLLSNDVTICNSQASCMPLTFDFQRHNFAIR